MFSVLLLHQDGTETLTGERNQLMVHEGTKTDSGQDFYERPPCGEKTQMAGQEEKKDIQKREKQQEAMCVVHMVSCFEKVPDFLSKYAIMS